MKVEYKAGPEIKELPSNISNEMLTSIISNFLVCILPDVGYGLDIKYTLDKGKVFISINSYTRVSEVTGD